MIAWLAFAFFLFVRSASADGLDAYTRCAEHLPFGRPVLNSEDARTTPVCHPGYFVLHNDRWKVPAVAIWHLTGPHTLGCEKRADKFFADAQVPEAARATPADYKNSGYSRGHHANAADNAWSKTRLAQTFAMSNMAPQLQTHNAGIWETGEEFERGAAWERSELFIYAGTIIPKSPKTIGDGVAVGKSWWKVIVDPEAKDAVAFIMPHKAIGKGDLAPWQTTIADIEEAASLELPLPEDIDRENEAKLWRPDVSAWHKKHAQMCAR